MIYDNYKLGLIKGMTFLNGKGCLRLESLIFQLWQVCVLYLFIFIYLLFYVAFNTVQVIS